MHVLTLTPFYPVEEDDAAGCFVAEPLPWLQREGIRSTVMAVRPAYRGRAHASPEALPASLIHYWAFPGNFGLPLSGAFLFARMLSEIRRLHETDPVDLIHAHGPLPCGHAAALIGSELGIPFVVSVHGLDAYATNQAKGYAGRWCKRVSQMVYRSARQVVCISEKVREQVLLGGNGSVRASVVYNGADPELFAPGEAGEEPNPVVLSIGNLIPIKGHEILIRAVAALRDRYPKLQCELIGEGPERRNLQQLVSQLGIEDRVHVSGRQSRRNVAEALRRCTVFALPSSYEGLGCVYLEAMASGKPVIAAREQGIGEIIRNGENGLLVGAGEVQELAEALARLLANPELRNAMGRAGRRTVLSGYTLAHQAHELAEVFRQSVAWQGGGGWQSEG
jgi:glycosyltransferase involved in cell wall biosynthesis